MTKIYQVTVIGDNTRQRNNHNTFSDVIRSFKANDILQGSAIWEASADGDEVRKGDKWLYVDKVNGVSIPKGWTAIIHKGTPICKGLVELDESELPEEEPPVIPNDRHVISLEIEEDKIVGIVVGDDRWVKEQ